MPTFVSEQRKVDNMHLVSDRTNFILHPPSQNKLVSLYELAKYLKKAMQNERLVTH